MLNKESIVKLLQENDKAVARALVLLNKRQTFDEQASENTRYLNGRGFRPCHARMGSSMAKFYERNGYLTPKQIAYWRARDRSGSMRIGIYWAQLVEEAQLKQQQPKPQQPVAPLPDLNGSPYRTPPEPERDFGNDMERRAVLNEIYNDVLDSDDPALVDPVKEEMDEIDAYWAKLQQLKGK